MRLQHLLRDIRRLREIERDEAAGRITSWQADRETFEVLENDEIFTLLATVIFVGPVFIGFCLHFSLVALLSHLRLIR